MKRCTCCGQLKPLEAFYRLHRNGEKRQAQCKVCVLAKARARNAALKAELGRPFDPEIVQQGEKYCPHCGETKPRTEFSLRPSTTQGVYGYCKLCELEVRAKYAAKYRGDPPPTPKVPQETPTHGVHDPARRNALRVWNQMRALSRIPPWVEFERDILPIYRDLHENYPTGREGYVVDHIVPVKGKFVSGLHTPENLQIILFRTNTYKGNEWGRHRGKRLAFNE